MAQVCAKTAGTYAVKAYGLIVLRAGDARGQDRDRKITYQLVECGEVRRFWLFEGVLLDGNFWLLAEALRKALSRVI